MSKIEIEKLLKELHLTIVKEMIQINSFTDDINVKDTRLEGGDVSYDIDIEAENIIINLLGEYNGSFKINLIMEGVGERTFNTDQKEEVTIIIDPIDGTREIMYDKRSAWILSGISYNSDPRISNIDTCIQTEIPIFKQNIFSQIIAHRGKGAFETLLDKTSFKEIRSAYALSSSKASDFINGFVCLINPFPGVKEKIGKVYDILYSKLIPNRQMNDAKVFSDEYLSTAGQVYLLATGKYRLVADLRPLYQDKILSLCCHPYDLSTILIAEEAGVLIRNHNNKVIDYPLDTKTNCSWIGFANNDLYRKYSKMFFEIL